MPFEFWGQSAVFIVVFGLILILPCVGVAIFGKKILDKIGVRPSQAPLIIIQNILPLVIVELIALGLLVAFYLLFSTK